MHPTDPKTTPKSQPALRLSALEIGAKRGIGPLSDLGVQVWHGQARPCVSCGELMRRDGRYCEHCGQDHSLAMISRMEAHAGPWYVHEHVRPFPGVTLDRLIRQAKRGILTGATIVRGPRTDHQWRFAAETPGLCKYVGFCFSCQCAASENEMYCSSCGIHLDHQPGETDAAPRADSSPSIAPSATPAWVAPRVPSDHSALTNPLDQLNNVTRQARHADDAVFEGQRSTRFPAWVFVIVLIAVFVGALFVVVRIRDKAISQAASKKETASQASSTIDPEIDSQGAPVTESAAPAVKQPTRSPGRTNATETVGGDVEDSTAQSNEGGP